MFVRGITVSIALLLSAACATAPGPAPLANAGPGQRAWAAKCVDSDGWDEPGPPFRVYGDTYFVGSCGITSLLIAGSKGHTLIHSGTDKGAVIVLANIRSLGFNLRDVHPILMSHEHFDHVGGMARVQAATGATIMATPAAAAVLRAGLPGPDDPQAASGHPAFAPVSGRIETFGIDAPQPHAGIVFQPIATPGHTPGATSWCWREREGEDCKAIVYVDSLNPIGADGFRFSAHPTLIADFRRGVARVAAAECELVIAPHPGAVALRARLMGQQPLLNRDGCRAFAADVTTRLDQRLAAEAPGG